MIVSRSFLRYDNEIHDLKGIAGIFFTPGPLWQGMKSQPGMQNPGALLPLTKELLCERRILSHRRGQ